MSTSSYPPGPLSIRAGLGGYPHQNDLVGLAPENVPSGTGGELSGCGPDNITRMPYTVYVLEDIQKKLYKGMTSSFSRRFSEHMRGKTKTTKSMPSLKLVYKEEYATFEQARARELYLKTAAGRRFLKKILST